MSTIKELKEITKQKKELAERQKAIREKLEESKEDRKEARKTQAEARKKVHEAKAALRNLMINVYEIFSEGDSDKIKDHADQIETASEDLVATMRKFAEAASVFEEVL